MLIAGQPLSIEASIGIALFPDDGDTVDELLQHADVAMYRAKRSGGGYLLYTDQYDRAEAAFRDAVQTLDELDRIGDLDLVSSIATAWFEPVPDMRDGHQLEISDDELAQAASLEHTDLLRVINTRVLLLLDRSADRYYLWLMNRWLAAPKLDGPWAALGNPPASLQKAKEVTVQSNQVEKPLLQGGAVPTVYVSTVPAELIVLKGRPALAPIAETTILEVTNTDADLFLYTPQQEYYALLSGRWFRAGSLQGPWEFVASGDLPRDFTVTRRYPRSSQ